MKLYYRVAQWLLGAVLAMSLAVLVACQGGPRGPLETVRLAVPALEQNALVYVAENQNYFAQNGLTVAIKDYDTGVATIDALSRGEVDIAEAAEFPFVRAVLDGQPVRVLASNDQFENDYIVARQDRGIAKIADLRGKRVGVTKQTIADFYLNRFLRLNGVAAQDITKVDVSPGQFVDAFGQGDVDALVAWQPYISQIQQKQPNRAVTWPVQSNQLVYGVLVTNSSWLSTHSETVRRFLLALEAAETFTVRQPAEAQAIVGKRLGYDGSYLADVWSQHQFSLSLDFSLLVAMQDEARWLVANNLAKRPIPDLMDSIYLDTLSAIKPEAVNFVRQVQPR